MNLADLFGRNQRRSLAHRLLIVDAFEELLVEILPYNPLSSTYDQRCELLQLLRGRTKAPRAALKTVGEKLSELQTEIEAITKDKEVGYVTAEEEALLDQLMDDRAKYEWLRDVLEDIFRIVNQVVRRVLDCNYLSDEEWSQAVHGVAQATGWNNQLLSATLQRFFDRIKPILVLEERRA